MYLMYPIKNCYSLSIFIDLISFKMSCILITMINY
nr:hypothetical protein RU989_pgp215 [Laurencia obtusa]WMP12796.1 hypothetical protein [Laurencia obtusa]